MQYKGQQISAQKVAGFVENLPEGNYFLDNSRNPVVGGLVIPKSRLVEAIQTCDIPFSHVELNSISLVRS